MRRIAAHSHTCPQPGADNHVNRHAVCHANPCGDSYADFHPRTVPYANIHANPYGNSHPDLHRRTVPYANIHANPYGNSHPDLHPRTVPHTGTGNRG